MSFETDLFPVLAPFVDSRVYPGTFPQSTAVPVWPAIRYTVVSRVPSVDACGDGGDATADTRVQIDCVARTYLDMKSLRAQVMTAMATFFPPAIWDGEFYEYDSETKTHRSSLDYLVYPSSGAGSPSF